MFKFKKFTWLFLQFDFLEIQFLKIFIHDGDDKNGD